MNFLEKLDYLISVKKINKKRLAEMSGIPSSTIYTIYQRGYENTGLATLKRLSEYFDVSLDYLIRDEITDPRYGKADPNEATFELLFRSLTEEEKQQTIRFMRGLVSTRSPGQIPLRENAG